MGIGLCTDCEQKKKRRIQIKTIHGFHFCFKKQSFLFCHDLSGDTNLAIWEAERAEQMAELKDRAAIRAEEESTSNAVSFKGKRRSSS